MAAIAGDLADTGRRGVPLPVGAALAGSIAGLVVGGGGARLAMRIAAALDEEQTGTLTEAGATVGEITTGGTFFILFAGTVVGFLLGVVYAVVRSWLSFAGRARAGVYGLVVLSTVGPLLVDDHNIDFLLLEPTAVSVALFAAVPFLYGIAAAWLTDRLSPRDPRWLRARPVRLAGTVVLGVFVLRRAVDLVHSTYLILA